MTVVVLFFFEPVQPMLQPRDRAERRHGDGQLDLVVGAGALEEGLIAIAVALADALALVNKIEPTDRC
jgi:hypothetical protein